MLEAGGVESTAEADVESAEVFVLSEALSAGTPELYVLVVVPVAFVFILVLALALLALAVAAPVGVSVILILLSFR